jgi:hypothetical protein
MPEFENQARRKHKKKDKRKWLQSKIEQSQYPMGHAKIHTQQEKASFNPFVPLVNSTSCPVCFLQIK